LRRHAGGRGGGRRPSPPVVFASAIVAAALFLADGALAGHELPFYPSFYPQEIRLDAMDPASAAPLIAKGTVQAYVGADPWTGRKLPADIGVVESLDGFLVLTLNPAAPGYGTLERRCERARHIAAMLTPGPGWIANPYPVTPFHADYLQHFDIVQARKASIQAARAGNAPRLRARGQLAERAAGKLRVTDGAWDATVEEIPLDETRNYVKDVLASEDVYRHRLPGHGTGPMAGR